ncbi:MAG: hypothetical protein ACR2OL_06890 [Anderseniella sp.]
MIGLFGVQKKIVSDTNQFVSPSSSKESGKNNSQPDSPELVRILGGFVVFLSILRILRFALLFVAVSPVWAKDIVKFGQKEYKVIGIAVSKSSSARLARFDDKDPEILKKYIYLPAGTILFLLDRFERDPRKYQLAVSEHGMPLYVLPRLNYFPKSRFTNMKGEYVAIPREKIPLKTKKYSAITLTPSEVYSMEFRDPPNIAITIDQAKMSDKYKGDEVIEVEEDKFAYVSLPVAVGRQLPTPTQIYDFNSALEDILKGVADKDLDKLKQFKDYISGRFVTRKECQDEINYGLNLDAGLAAEFDTWLSPIEAKLALSGTFKATRKHSVGTEFTIERFAIGDRIYEIKDEGVASNCVNLEENRRIRIAAGRIIAQLNTQDATDLKLKTDPKGRIIYTCRDEYLKVEKTLRDQELREGPARLLMSRFTIYEDVRNAAKCKPAD